VAGQGLSTWAIHGGNLTELSQQLHGKPGVDQTVAFGSSMHVTGKDAQLLERTLRAVTQGTEWRPQAIATNLEDVFIYLMKHSADNFEELP
jgi:ABC-2 type transport system ATP-binding protein